MRDRARRGALALAALAALAAAGCDLVSSLTPFGLEERGTDPSQGIYSGSWAGSTSGEGTVTFTVVGNEVIGLVLTHVAPCGLEEEFTFGDALPVLDGAFSDQIDVEPQGTATIAGAFTSRDGVRGTYAFDNLQAVPGCPTSGGGIFTATKLPEASAQEGRP